MQVEQLEDNQVSLKVTEATPMTQEQYEDLIKHSGKPKYFDINQYLDSVEMMASFGKTMFASRMLLKVPAYYRDYPTPRQEKLALELAADLNSGKHIPDIGEKPTMFDLADYIESMTGMINADEYQFVWDEMIPEAPKYYHDKHYKSLYEFKKWAAEKLISLEEYACGEVEVLAQPITKEAWDHPAFYRFRIVDQLVEMYNKQGKTPFVIDLGPANYTLVQGFRMMGRSFKYKGIALRELKEKPVEWQEKQQFDQPVIFVAEEVIEHLWQPDEIYFYCVKNCFEPDYVVLSTPRHTYGGGVDHRRSLYMGHIRTYTPKDLLGFSHEHWPLHAWQLVDGPQLVTIGAKEGYQSVAA